MKGHGNTQNVFHVAVLLNNNFLLSYNYQEEDGECSLRIWDPSYGIMVNSIPIGGGEACCLLAISNEQVAIGYGEGAIKVVDLIDTDKSITKEKAHSENIYTLISLSNRYLVSCGNDGDGLVKIPTIKIWDFQKESLILLQTIQTNHLSVICSIAVSIDQKQLVSGDIHGNIKIWPIGINI